MIPGVSDATFERSLDLYPSGPADVVRPMYQDYLVKERGCPQDEVDALCDYFESPEAKAGAAEVAKLFARF